MCLFRCLEDVDDEVRDRAALYLKVLGDQPLAETYVKDGMLFHAFSCQYLIVSLLRLHLLARRARVKPGLVCQGPLRFYATVQLRDHPEDQPRAGVKGGCSYVL